MGPKKKKSTQQLLFDPNNKLPKLTSEGLYGR